MIDATISRGCRIAEEAMLFSLCYGPATKAGELRQAIRILFGPEIDDALAQRYAPLNKEIKTKDDAGA
jgi:hypothetical protein